MSLKANPFNQLRSAFFILVLYGIIACTIGHYGRIFEYKVLTGKIVYILPFTLFIFPAFLEELFFRGVLIPRSSFEKSHKHKLLVVIISTILFVIWHPFNAYLFNQGSQALFFNSYFLAIVFILGLSCSYSYIITRSLWTPIIIHWLTVLVWVLLLGGRNLIKENRVL